ncbi:tryptophan halogenase family protein [Microbulbifer sp. YPW1]|uniref:tryptophan halogenase family protein n=1 Tax=Microbulbifer sp. YPW1 TaxID=2745199 RepID=UPI00159A2446|nr:tryptophan halogenase family protein [Microbulbifer sp. YPW1]QKX17233.1 tryptophan 7-halogenase [Microbulbifer sp. YPW1]
MNKPTLDEKKISRVVIAGGGTAGWIAAAALSKKLGELLDITLVESAEIGTIGVGEATIPPMRVFHRLLGIDEREFMRATRATFKLGIQFENWGQQGDRYIHAFGKNGRESWLAEFHHFWLEGRVRGIDSEIGDYCLELQAARQGKFATSTQSSINYAYHLDAGLYAQFLRKFSEQYGARRIEGNISGVEQCVESGNITGLRLADGRLVEGDLFVDCTGFRGLLIEQTLHTGYEDWSHWLPCDSAVALQTEGDNAFLPYTRSIAGESGWQWRIPLQHRTGNGHVFCSQHLSDDEACSQLLGGLDGKPLTDPRVIRFRTGRRRKVWNKNCIALGLASGFVEPLESTSIHLVIAGITRLMQCFPYDGISPSTAHRFNRESREELEKIRDFIVLHYHLTRRNDTSFWRYCASMEVPETLRERMELFRDSAYAHQAEGELFRVDSWVQVMVGQGLVPRAHHPLPKLMSTDELSRFLAGLRENIQRAVSPLPSHDAFVRGYCQAEGCLD